MSIRLDPRRLTALKHLAGEAGTRPGELVRQWVEERIDAERRGEGAPTGGATVPGGRSAELEARLASLADRVAALEAASGNGNSQPRAEHDAERTAGKRAVSASRPERETDGDQPAEQPQPQAPPKRGRKRVSAKPSGPRVALHDEITAVIAERGPLPASEIAELISERGRYAPPRSGKPLDAATVNARVSNPTYRGRFTRSEGRIGLAEPA